MFTKLAGWDVRGSKQGNESLEIREAIRRDHQLLKLTYDLAVIKGSMPGNLAGMLASMPANSAGMLAGMPAKFETVEFKLDRQAKAMADVKADLVEA